MIVTSTTRPVVATTSVVSATPPTPQSLPTADDANHPVRISGLNALTPGGQPFAKRSSQGWISYGMTSINLALKIDSAMRDGLGPSRLAVVSAVSGNEGKLEAVNSYDRAFLSFGIMQWTIGTDNFEGELAALLSRVRNDDGAAFSECFGRFGIDLAINDGATTGRLILSGRTIVSADAKCQFRGPQWAYRFWRAGQHPSVRRSEIRHAVARIDRFAGTIVRGHRLSDWLSSELGMALLLDQHVNTPGNVPATITQAITSLVTSGGAPPDPANWTEEDEHSLIERYVARRNQTSMTDSQGRANRLFIAAQNGLIQSARGSFT